jgi:hypothetical protein
MWLLCMCSLIAVAKSDLYFKYVAIPDGEIQIRKDPA